MCVNCIYEFHAALSGRNQKFLVAIELPHECVIDLIWLKALDVTLHGVARVWPTFRLISFLISVNVISLLCRVNLLRANEHFVRRLRIAAFLLFMRRQQFIWFFFLFHPRPIHCFFFFLHLRLAIKTEKKTFHSNAIIDASHNNCDHFVLVDDKFSDFSSGEMTTSRTSSTMMATKTLALSIRSHTINIYTKHNINDSRLLLITSVSSSFVFAFLIISDTDWYSA